MNKLPTEKQIEFADRIAYMFNLDFPTGSPDFNRWSYWQFINQHIDAYLDACTDPEDEMAWYDPWAEAGYGS